MDFQHGATCVFPFFLIVFANFYFVNLHLKFIFQCPPSRVQTQSWRTVRFTYPAWYARWWWIAWRDYWAEIMQQLLWLIWIELWHWTTDYLVFRKIHVVKWPQFCLRDHHEMYPWIMHHLRVNRCFRHLKKNQLANGTVVSFTLQQGSVDIHPLISFNFTTTGSML